MQVHLAVAGEAKNGPVADYHLEVPSTLEATHGQNDSFFSQLPYKCHQNRVASVGD